MTTSHRNRSSTLNSYIRRCFGFGLYIKRHKQSSHLQIKRFDRRREASRGAAVHNRGQKFPTPRAKARLESTLVGLQFTDEDFDGVCGCTGPCRRAAVAEKADFGGWRLGGLRLLGQRCLCSYLGSAARFETCVMSNLTGKCSMSRVNINSISLRISRPSDLSLIVQQCNMLST